MHLANPQADQSNLIARVRQQPNDVDARLQLFRFAVMEGNWARAANQLDVASALDACLAHTAMVYQRNIQCEQVRHAVLEGRADPLFLGTPPAWASYLVQALKTTDAQTSGSLVYAAMEQAEALPGFINGQSFTWLADADNRFGPLLEIFIDGKYYWLPFEVVERISIHEPEDLLDLAWCPCEVTLTNGGTCNGFIPTRYPGTEAAANEDVKFARMTQWIPWSGDLHKGTGQRTLVSDVDDYALLDCREIIFSHPKGHA